MSIECVGKKGPPMYCPESLNCFNDVLFEKPRIDIGDQRISTGHLPRGIDVHGDAAVLRDEWLPTRVLRDLMRESATLAVDK
jgi:hypothetical protein